MRMEISRRDLLFGVGGVVVAGSIAGGLTRQGGRQRVPQRTGPAEPCCAPAEFDGWLLTVRDKEALIAME
jgi:hypothetical protein